MNWRKNPLLHQLRARPRLVLAFFWGLLIYLGLPWLLDWRDTTRFLFSWNAAVCLYLLLAGEMIVRSTHEKIRQRSLEQDVGRKTVLLLVVIAAVASLLAIVDELSAVKNLTGQRRLGPSR